MKRFLLPFAALILVLGFGFTTAQNINKAIQLSQDPTGAFGVDTNNNVYFPAHVLNSGSTPAISNGGTGTAATVVGSDTIGTITGGANTNTTANLTFRRAFVNTPVCIVVSQNPATTPIAYNTVLTGINITSTIGAAIINYFCSGSK